MVCLFSVLFCGSWLLKSPPIFISMSLVLSGIFVLSLGKYAELWNPITCHQMDCVPISKNNLLLNLFRTTLYLFFIMPTFSLFYTSLYLSWHICPWDIYRKLSYSIEILFSSQIFFFTRLNEKISCSLLL